MLDRAAPEEKGGSALLGSCAPGLGWGQPAWCEEGAETDKEGPKLLGLEGEE